MSVFLADHMHDHTSFVAVCEFSYFLCSPPLLRIYVHFCLLVWKNFTKNNIYYREELALELLDFVTIVHS